MARTWRFSFGGIGAGFLGGFILVGIMSGAEPTGDRLSFSIFLGSFLASAGAVAGALIGGFADLLEYFRIRDEAAKNTQAQRESEPRL